MQRAELTSAAAGAGAKKSGTQLVRIDSGVASLEGEIELFRCLQDEGGADLLGTIVDSFTRVCEFKRAEEGLKESIKQGRTVINGYPIVVHGVVRGGVWNSELKIKNSKPRFFPRGQNHGRENNRC